MGFWDGVKEVGSGVINGITGLTKSPDADIEAQRKRLLQRQAAAAGGFADTTQGSYTSLGRQGNGALAALARQASGQDSVSAEQLRQGIQQGVAAQRSFAAGAAPANAAQAARTAAIQAGRLTSGLAGQQALAGLQERNQAQGQYAQLLQALRGQDLQATQGARGQAIQGYSAGNAGTPAPSLVQQYAPLVQAGASLATALSDERTKKNIAPGSGEAAAAIDQLAAAGPKTFRYRDPKDGRGQYLGTTTADLKRAGLGQAVVPTPRGEAVDAAQLALGNTALIAELARRVSGRDTAADKAQASFDSRRALLAQQALDRRRELLAQPRDNAAESIIGSIPATSPVRGDPGVDRAALDAQAALDARRALLAQQALNRRRELLRTSAQPDRIAYVGGQ